MPTISQSASTYLPQRVELQPYRKPPPEKLRSVSKIKTNLNSLKNVSSKAARRGACAFLKTPLGKAVLAIAAVAVAAAAVGASVGLTVGRTQADSTSAQLMGLTTTQTTTTSTSATTQTSTTSTSTTATTSSTTTATTSTTSTTSRTTSTSSTSTSTATTTSSTTTTTTTTATTSTSTTTTSSSSTSTTTSTSSTSTSTSTTTSTSSTSTSTTSSTSTSTTTSSTTTTTPPPTYMYWPLDSNFNDFFNIYNGIGINNPAFVTPGYNGYGAALSINASNAQYVLVPLYKNMTFTSFTWEIWGYPTSLANYDCLMVGMCQTPVFSRCMYLMIRLNATYFAFYANDCWSTTVVPINQWHHFGFVYDYSAQTQYVYLNGLLICTQSLAGPFLGSSGAITIGAINNTGTTPFYFWTGYLDEVQYVSRVKTPTEILDDATLVAYYSFDNGSFYDLGPNRINGTWINVTSVAGRVNQGILLNGNGQAFRASGLTLLGMAYRSYSISMWIYRSSPATGDGTLIHVSPSPTGFGAWCLPILGLSASYQAIAQNWNSTWTMAVTGPVVPIATWTHLVTSYSATNGIRLWVNGTLIGSSGPFPYSPSGSPNSIIAGSALGSVGSCATGNIAHGQFYGRLDELRVYARELNAADVFTLANP